MKYPNVVRAIAEHPWEILEETYATILEIASMRASGKEFTPDEIQARIGSGPSSRPSLIRGSVGVLPLYGVLFPRASLFTEMSGGTSLQRWAADFQQMVDDQDVAAILIDCHSPGGSTYMCAETAAKVRAARGKKPIVAIANTLMASAAYHIASQADEIVASPSSMVGSIGVYMVHTDWSKFNEGVGVDPTWIFAGKYKTEGNEDEPLGDEARAHLQEIVDETMALFVSDVAKGRGVKESQVRNGYGEGRVLTAKLAVEAGLADRVDTLENTIARLSKGQIAATKARAETDPDPTSHFDEGAAPTVELVDRREESATDEAEEEIDLTSFRELVADTRAELEARRVRTSLQAIANDMRTRPSTPQEAAK